MIRALALLLSWTTMFAASTSINAQICQVAPTSPTIVNPGNVSSTKSHNVLVSGTSADDNYQIDFSDNGSQVGMTTSDSSGSFAATIPIVKSRNLITAIADNKCGMTAASSPILVSQIPGHIQTTVNQPESVAVASRSGKSTSTVPLTSLTIPPGVSGPLKLAVSGSEAFSTDQQSVYINGTTSIPATIDVTVNGTVIARLYTGDQKTFSVLLPLILGSNSVKVTATSGKLTVSTYLNIVRLQSGSTINRYWMHNKKRLYIVLAGIVTLIIVGYASVKLFGRNAIARRKS